MCGNLTNTHMNLTAIEIPKCDDFLDEQVLRDEFLKKCKDHKKCTINIDKILKSASKENSETHACLKRDAYVYFQAQCKLRETEFVHGERRFIDDRGNKKLGFVISIVTILLCFMYHCSIAGIKWKDY